MEDEQAYDRIDQEEINELFAKTSNVYDNNNANTTDNDNPIAVCGNNGGSKVTYKSTSVGQTRDQTKPERWNYSHKKTTKPK